MGNLWAAQPTLAELLRDVTSAAGSLTPTTLIDPRRSARYLATLGSRILRLQANIVLRAVLITDADEADVPDQTATRFRSVA